MMDEPASRGDLMGLNLILGEAGLSPLSKSTEANFGTYLALLMRWNSRMNLTAIRNPGGIVRRHFVESIACAQALPKRITTLLDFGSGGGFPGIPIALCRPEILITLSESQMKKAGFLQEAVRSLGLNSQVWSRRAEDIGTQFDCVTLRAVDRMDLAVEASSNLVNPGGWLAVLTTSAGLRQVQAWAGGGFEWREVLPLPGSEQRVIGIGRRMSIAKAS